MKISSLTNSSVLSCRANSTPHSSNICKLSYTKQRDNRISTTNNPFKRYIINSSWHNIPSRPKSLFKISSSGRDEFITEDEASLGITPTNEEFNRVNCLVWVLHQSARSFSLGVQNLELFKSLPELSNAWNGVDVHAWLKPTAYQVT